MKYRIILEMDTPKIIFEQIKRNGCEVVKEGDAYAVRVPNRVLGQRNYNVEIQDKLPSNGEARMPLARTYDAASEFNESQ